MAKKGFYVWWINNKIHRDDGPAVVSVEKREWYLYGQKKSGVEEWLEENDINPSNMSVIDSVAYRLRFL